MTRIEFLRLNTKERHKYLSSMNKKQIQKLCKAFGLNVHGGTFAMSTALVNMK